MFIYVCILKNLQKSFLFSWKKKSLVICPCDSIWVSIRFNNYDSMKITINIIIWICRKYKTFTIYYWLKLFYSILFSLVFFCCVFVTFLTLFIEQKMRILRIIYYKVSVSLIIVFSLMCVFIMFYI